ncbi:MAG: PilZ domain-containing protein [Pyrinomonadaceae bacterium]
METPTTVNERRNAHRFKAQCDAELTGDLSLLDYDVEPTSEPLVFCGETVDVSEAGLRLILPSTLLDERFCESDHTLSLLLHLPTSTVQLNINPIHCEPLTRSDAGQGYVLGAQITGPDEGRAEFESYLFELAKSEAGDRRTSPPISY